MPRYHPRVNVAIILCCKDRLEADEIVRTLEAGINTILEYFDQSEIRIDFPEEGAEPGSIYVREVRQKEFLELHATTLEEAEQELKVVEELPVIFADSLEEGPLRAATEQEIQEIEKDPR